MGEGDKSNTTCLGCIAHWKAERLARLQGAAIEAHPDYLAVMSTAPASCVTVLVQVKADSRITCTYCGEHAWWL